MPTYYDCGCSEEWPSDETLHSSEYCESCREPDDHDDDDGYGNQSEALAAARYVDSLLTAEVPAMFSPNIRREVSCEWEAASGVQTARSALDNLPNGAPFEYHSDVTCGGELVFGRLHLADREAAHRYGRSLAVLDQLRRASAVRVSFDAGHHVHIAARNENGRGISASNLVSLYAVFAHCEDLLYRLAAAGWSMHRSENVGTYSAPMRKLADGVRRTPRHVGMAIGGDRYQGLNVTPYLANIAGCRCGAFRFGEWESCECGDHGATIEWRLWNGSISARKIRTYIAISAVLTDYAANVDPRDCAELAEHPFTGTGEVDEEALAVQLDYLVSRPGFTARDRKDIRWLVSFSPGMGTLADEFATARSGVMSDDIAPSLA